VSEPLSGWHTQYTLSLDVLRDVVSDVINSSKTPHSQIGEHQDKYAGGHTMPYMFSRLATLMNFYDDF